ncbi:pyridoxamine 5'-phosphate oxidase family protein [Tepidiforma flava]|uniref:Pyridoxamine 5'-phosphate oxidase family protein n=1 Tax=Tepidiforma flava TaxID=3004094 RepID=A0ABY7M3M3_9CHLR|nr:pyridoxamine 5'-phosphate oxidase family protein [Tepidiforma flava]WBL35197.1 pyridoxamine 5'-phosphate oxidase family protein [Tepidiforma flava]
MTGTLSREEILAQAYALGLDQPGGTLATTHAEDGTPYVTFVLFHLRPNGEVLFGSGTRPQHTRNIRATPEVSFLIDNREVIRSDWTAFHRAVIEGRAEEVAKESADYTPLLQELETKNKMAAVFTDRGILFRIRPRRLILMRGFEAARHIVDFGAEDAG